MTIYLKLFLIVGAVLVVLNIIGFYVFSKNNKDFKISDLVETGLKGEKAERRIREILAYRHNRGKR